MMTERDVPDSVERCAEWQGIPLMPTSYRGSEWEQFAGMVRIHVDQYTVPQYQDYPNDQLTSWTAEDCIKQVMKYCNRFGKNQRGMQDQMLDFKKAAHYLCVAYFKVQEGKV